MIYLASPYTHPDPAVREMRFRAACRQAAEMLRCGIAVFSPIAYSHTLVGIGLPIEWEFWREFDRAFVELCTEVWVLALDGWQESRGVREEIELARELHKPVVIVEPGGDTAEQAKHAKEKANRLSSMSTDRESCTS